jgi:hypothetical protein
MPRPHAYHLTSPEAISVRKSVLMPICTLYGSELRDLTRRRPESAFTLAGLWVKKTLRMLQSGDTSRGVQRRSAREPEHLLRCWLAAGGYR